MRFFFFQEYSSLAWFLLTGSDEFPGKNLFLTHEFVSISLLPHFPKTSRGSPLLSRDIKILTTIANSDHKQPNEWEQLWPWQVRKHRLHMRIIC